MTIANPTHCSPAPKRVLCLFAHPDDESYSVAGTIALHLKDQAQVWIAYCTRGEAGPDFLRVKENSSLARIRTKEAHRACEILGANPPLFLDLPDGKLSGIATSRGRALIRRLIEQIRPHLLFALGPDGAYGHLDHIRCYEWLNDEIRRIPATERPRCLWAAFPKGTFTQLHKKLVSSGARRFVAGMDSKELGLDEARIDLRVDVSTVADTKRRVMASHESQLPDASMESFILYPYIKPFFDTEMFVHAHGPAIPEGASSPLEGL